MEVFFFYSNTFQNDEDCFDSLFLVTFMITVNSLRHGHIKSENNK